MRWYDRLRRRSEIAHVRRRGRRISLASVTAFVLPGDGRTLRIAIAAAKSVGTAVVRNRIRRRIRGAFEALGPGKDAPGMLFLVVRDEAVGLPYTRIVEDVRILLGRGAR